MDDDELKDMPQLWGSGIWGICCFFVIAIIILFVAYLAESRKPVMPKYLIDVVATPVDDAPEGTYILEYSNGKKEILHPDGKRSPLVQSEED